MEIWEITPLNGLARVTVGVAWQNVGNKSSNGVVVFGEDLVVKNCSYISRTGD